MKRRLRVFQFGWVSWLPPRVDEPGLISLWWLCWDLQWLTNPKGLYISDIGFFCGLKNGSCSRQSPKHKHTHYVLWRWWHWFHCQNNIPIFVYSPSLAQGTPLTDNQPMYILHTNLEERERERKAKLHSSLFLSLPLVFGWVGIVNSFSTGWGKEKTWILESRTTINLLCVI